MGWATFWAIFTNSSGHPAPKLIESSIGMNGACSDAAKWITFASVISERLQSDMYVKDPK
jgi:hypothetical protein